MPGVSGNPAGRPRKLPITDAIREMLEKVGDGATDNAARVAAKLLDMALAGNLEAIREIADRAEGKAKQRSEVSGPDGGPIPFDIPDTREALERRIAELLGKPTTSSETKPGKPARSKKK